MGMLACGGVRSLHAAHACKYSVSSAISVGQHPMCKITFIALHVCIAVLQAIQVQWGAFAGYAVYGQLRGQLF
eukprot:359936-Chlamydomonas_euryale.AAC.7